MSVCSVHRFTSVETGFHALATTWHAARLSLHVAMQACGITVVKPMDSKLSIFGALAVGDCVSLSGS